MPDSSFPSFAFESVDDATRRLQAAAHAAGVSGLHRLPFNRYAADGSVWWLSPSSENPAFKYGKLIVSGDVAADPSDLFVGFYVERGVGQTAAPMFADTARGRRLIMDGTWSWHRTFRPALRTGRFEAAASSAEQAAGQPLLVAVDGGAVMPPSTLGDDRVPLGTVDIVRYTYSGGALVLLDYREGEGRLAGLRTATTLGGLGSLMDQVPESDWTWIDFHIGLRLDKATRGSASWSADELWRRAGAPWDQWLA
jgi:hypothetical protein